MEQSKEQGANVEVGFNERGKARVGKDCVKVKDIVIRREVQVEAVSKGGGDDKGCDGELSRSGGNGRGGMGIS